jgi:IS5 family transposase
MLRTVADQPTLWEAILPDELRRLPVELARVDALLDDPLFFAPFVPFFDPRMGRPSTPMETYLRLMFLRVPLPPRVRVVVPGGVGLDHLAAVLPDRDRSAGAAPDHPDEADHPLWVGRGRRVERGPVGESGRGQGAAVQSDRVDTTVVPSNVAYPTDSGLLAKAVNRIAATARRIQAAGGAVRTKLRDRSRAAGRRAHDLNAKLRTRSAAAREEALEVVRRKNAELAELAETAADEAERLLVNAKKALRKAKIDAEKQKANGQCDAVTGRRRGRLARAVNDLTELLDATRKIIEQTRERLAGRIPDCATRQVSLHDPDARPIRKGRLGKPVEFGNKAQMVDNDDGIVLDHDVQPGNPADGPRLKPAVERVIGRTRRKPRTVTADRGYGEAGIDDDLHDLGVRNVVIPKGQTQQRPASPGTTSSVPAAPEMANRLRRPHQHPQTRLRMGPNHDRHHRRSPDLDRTRSPRPQPHQDQRPGRLTTPPGDPCGPDAKNTNQPNPPNPLPGDYFRSK